MSTFKSLIHSVSIHYSLVKKPILNTFTFQFYTNFGFTHVTIFVIDFSERPGMCPNGDDVNDCDYYDKCSYDIQCTEDRSSKCCPTYVGRRCLKPEGDTQPGKYLLQMFFIIPYFMNIAMNRQIWFEYFSRKYSEIPR